MTKLAFGSPVEIKIFKSFRQVGRVLVLLVKNLSSSRHNYVGQGV